MDYANKLRYLREQKNLSREKLAEMADISVSSVQMYENGERVPRDGVKITLAKILDDSVENIFFTNYNTLSDE